MIKIKIKQRKADSNMWWIILGAIIVIIVAGIVIYIVTGGLFAQQKNVNLLSACKNQGGVCKSNCGPDETGFFKLGGCPDENDKSKEYCCVPNERKK